MSRFGYTVAGFGGGYPAAAGGFNIDIQDTKANILARTGDDAGTIAFVTSGDNQYDFLVYDGSIRWFIFANDS